MNDCITRADAVKAACKLCPLVCKNTEVCPTRDVVFGAIPAADVRPVKEGYWQEGEFKYLTCSVCGCDTNLYDQHGFPIGQRKGHQHPCFCPHCGADMTGGADG